MQGPTPHMPDEAFIGYDWYETTVPAFEGRKYRTNHSFAQLGVQFTNSTTIGLKMNRDWQTPPKQLGTGSIRYFLGMGTPTPVPLAFDRVLNLPNDHVLFQTLSKSEVYWLWVEFTQGPGIGADPPGQSVLEKERFRDYVGFQGVFREFEGFLADPDAQFTQWPMPANPLNYIIQGDSIQDGIIIESDGSIPSDAAALAWAQRAVANAAGLQSRVALGIHQAYSAWFGCRLVFPFQPDGPGGPTFNSKEELNTARPWAFPYFLPDGSTPGETGMLDRWHPGSPLFSDRVPAADVDLYVYTLSTNDRGTGRLASQVDYEADIQANVAGIQAAFPNAKILVVSAHLENVGGADNQRVFMANAMNNPPISQATNPDVKFVDLFQKVTQPGGPGATTNVHFDTSYHNYLAVEVGNDINDLLNGV